MRGVTLTNLFALLKAHVGDDIGTNSTMDPVYTLLLASKQQEYCSMFDWDFLKARWDVNIGPGQRYAAFPTTTSVVDEQTSYTAKINFDRPVLTEVFYNQYWLSVERGITSTEYNFSNPTLGQRLDPIQRWRIAQNVDDTNPDTFEIWPVPTTPQTFRFTATRLPQALSTGSDVADLDDQLLCLSVAGGILAGRNQKNASLKLSEAKTRLLAVRAGMSGDSRDCFIGGRPDSASKLIRVAPLVLVAK